VPPLTITYPTLSKRRYPNTIGIQSVAKVEVLNLHLVLTCCHSTSDVLVLTDGGKGGIDGVPFLQHLPSGSAPCLRAMVAKK
jgi:hypothetical protein